MRILYIDIDSLRPDHLGCYGYGRNTSPHIDRLAAEGVRFGSCYTSDMPCMPSRTSLFSGRMGIHHGCVAHTGTRAEYFPEGEGRRFRSDLSRTAWMRRLRDAGLRTVTFSGFAERHAAWHWLAGFSEIHDTGLFGHEVADDVTPGVLDWLRTSGSSDNGFLHVNLWDVHMPYRTPSSIGNRFASAPLADPWITQGIMDRHSSEPGARSTQNALFLAYASRRPDLNPAQLETLKDFKLMIDGYDTGVSYADEHVGRIIQALNSLGILDETAVIVSADHGECLGELNAYGGHCFADRCTARVPLIIRWPGVTTSLPGTCHKGLWHSGDLAPTVCDLTGASIPESWDFQSMTPVWNGNPDQGRDHLVLSQLAQACQRSVVFRHDGADYLYLRTYRGYSYDLPDEMLFDTSTDPHELTDIAGTQTVPMNAARAILQEWQEGMLAGSPHPDPLETVLRESE